VGAKRLLLPNPALCAAVNGSGAVHLCELPGAKACELPGERFWEKGGGGGGGGGGEGGGGGGEGRRGPNRQRSLDRN